MTFCNIYKASTRDELYVYVAHHLKPETVDTAADTTAPRDELLEALPDSLRTMLGRPRLVMQLDLSTTPKLARVDITHVKDMLSKQGYFVQFPPEGLIAPNAPAPEGLRGA